jgi:non-canonical (house-cleaning) NTP pyrophosphatase
MLNRSPITNVYIATQSEVKLEALNRVIAEYSSFYPQNAVISLSIQPEANPAQPVNSGYQCAENRLQALISEVKSQGVEVDSPSFLFIAVESGLATQESEQGDTTATDVCFVKGRRGNINLEAFSYPIQVPAEWYTKYQATGPETHALGYTTTFGDYLSSQIEGLDSKNWMAHEDFGAFNRVDQVQDVLKNLLGKFMIEDKISYYEDFPKPGVTFKDLSFVIGDPLLLRILVSYTFHSKSNRFLD